MNKTVYKLVEFNIPDNLKEQLYLAEFFKNKTFILQTKPEKQRCLWLQFIDTNEIWRSATSITNIDELVDGFLIKTRGEFYHIHKCKQS